MKFDIDKSIEILERTPSVLFSMLYNISEEWSFCNEGVDTWSAYDILGHLIHGERTDWMARVDIILSDEQDKTFTPFDRFGQFQESKGKSMNQLIDQFVLLRKRNIEYIRFKKLTESDFLKTGIHPTFGKVTLAQLLSTWAIHDLNHLAQIARVMAKQYKSEVGPWSEFLRILK